MSHGSEVLLNFGLQKVQTQKGRATSHRYKDVPRDNVMPQTAVQEIHRFQHQFYRPREAGLGKQKEKQILSLT